MALRRPGHHLAWIPPVLAAVAARPALWLTAIRQVQALAAPGWWRRPPFLPLPPPAYLRFRMVTAYGDAGAAPSADDVVTYLGWCRQEHRRPQPEAGRRGRALLPLRAVPGR